MRAALAIAVVLLAAPPAVASETIGRGALTAGPVLAGGSVLWADALSGRPRVLASGPGRSPAVLGSWPRATTRDTGRTVAALAGSATSVAAVVETCTSRFGSDFVALGCAERAFGGPAGTFAPFGWPLPRRGVRGCPGPRAPVSVAAGAGVIAVAYTPVCQGIVQLARAGTRSRIVVRRGAAVQGIGSSGARQARIAGRFLAYLEGRRWPEHVVLYDLTRRQRVRSVAGNGLAAIDVQADGTLALVRTVGARSCVFVLGRREVRERRLTCRLATSRVAIAGGRVLVQRGTDRGTRLVLLGRGGKRVLERAYRPRTIGGFDLAADQAVWSVGPVSGRQRIEHERL